ncbi:MAG: hypothetical protein EZS28_042000, partial [Streblomastix strix]
MADAIQPNVQEQ